MTLQPFEVLLDIEKKSLTYAKPLPRQKVMAKAWQGIGFSTQDTYFVVPLQEILEVLPYPEVTSLLGSKTWFHGFANLRGGLLPIIDLQGFLTHQDAYATMDSRVLVVKIEQIKVGFVVERVLGLKKFREEARLISAMELDEAYASHILGEFDQDPLKWKIFSFKKIIENTDFYHVLREEGLR